MAGEREAAARERAIADELQRRLMPEHEFAPEHLEVVTYYRPAWRAPRSAATGST